MAIHSTTTNGTCFFCELKARLKKAAGKGKAS